MGYANSMPVLRSPELVNFWHCRIAIPNDRGRVVADRAHAAAPNRVLLEPRGLVPYLRLLSPWFNLSLQSGFPSGASLLPPPSQP